jgi:glycosyltransferase involved in cell wall biosynthesis
MNGVSRPPLVSVVMSVLNGAATVGAAVRSIQLQTLQDWELIVIDNGSSDWSGSIVREFNDARIKVVPEPPGAGFATRLNQAVGLSRGEFIARMDADDVCFPERLERQIAHLQQDPRLDVLGCGAVVFADDATLVGELPVGLTHREITARPFHGFPFPHPTWCGRAAWFRSNPYDSSLLKAEDQDLLLRTFRTSTFGALETVLFGYRQNQLDQGKLLPGRRTFVGSLWRYAQHSGEFIPALKGMATHVAKGAVDIATLNLGFNRSAQRYRLKPVAPSTRQQWEDLQKRLPPTELTR